LAERVFRFLQDEFKHSIITFINNILLNNFKAFTCMYKNRLTIRDLDESSEVVVKVVVVVVVVVVVLVGASSSELLDSPLLRSNNILSDESSLVLRKNGFINS